MKKKLDYSEIRLDHGKPELLFVQLEEELLRLFQGMTSRTDSRLPSIRKLSELLGVHRKTVAKTYGDLLSKGVIKRESPNILRVAESLPRKQLAPFPNIGIIGSASVFLPVRAEQRAPDLLHQGHHRQRRGKKHLHDHDPASGL